MSPKTGYKSPNVQISRNMHKGNSRSELPAQYKLNNTSKESFQTGNVNYDLSGGIHPRKLDKSIDTVESQK